MPGGAEGTARNFSRFAVLSSILATNHRTEFVVDPTRSRGIGE